MQTFGLGSQSYAVGEKVRIVHRFSGKSEPAKVVWILGPYITFRRIPESELGENCKQFPTSD